MLYTMASVTGHGSWALDRRIESRLPAWRWLRRPAPAGSVRDDAEAPG